MATKGSPDFVVVTGLSGSGKSQAVKVFEDLDYYTLDNLPPALMKTTLDVCRRGGHPLPRRLIRSSPSGFVPIRTVGC